jgi:tetratricopeptide (TPR) repeat protein
LLEEPPYDVFVSYSHLDSDWVHGRLVPGLRRAGVKVCIDVEDFDVGVPLLANIENAAHSSRRLIIVLSQAWVDSEWTAFEAFVARADDLTALKTRILPALIATCEVPQYISQLAYADFTAGDFEATLERLVQAAKGQRRLPTPPRKLTLLAGGRRTGSSVSPHVAKARKTTPSDTPSLLSPKGLVGSGLLFLSVLVAVLVGLPRLFPSFERGAAKVAVAGSDESLVLCAVPREASKEGAALMDNVVQRLLQKLPKRSRVANVVGRCSDEGEAARVGKVKLARAVLWIVEAGETSQIWMLGLYGIRQNDANTNTLASGVVVATEPMAALALGIPAKASAAELGCAVAQAEGTALSAAGDQAGAIDAARRAMRCMRTSGARIAGRQQSYLFFAYLAAWVGGDHVAAVDALSDALSIERSPEAFNNRGVEWVRLGKLEAAAKDFSEALTMKADYAEALNNRGNVYRLLGDMDRATADLQAALALKPSWSTVIVNLGVLDYQLSRIDSAKARLEKAIELDPKSAVVRNFRGLLFLDRGEFVAAREEFERAQRLEPGSAAVLNNLANVEDELGLFVTALKHYEEALARNPNSAAIISNRAATLRHLGRQAEARSDLRRAVELEPTNVVMLFNLANLEEDPTARQVALRKVLEMDPNSVFAYAPLVSATMQTDINKAREIAARALELPIVANARTREQVLARADILAASGRYQAALRDYDALVVASDEDGRARCARAKALSALGKLDAASRDLERLGDSRPECNDLRDSISRRPGKRGGSSRAQ